MRKLYLAAALLIAGTMFSHLPGAEKSRTKDTDGRTKKYAEFSRIPEIPAEGNASPDTAKLKYLSGKKMDIMLKMHEMRVQLIRKDPRLAALRKRILSLTLELSQELNAKREMFELNNNLAAVEDEIKEILAKQKEEAEKYSAGKKTENK